MAEPTAPTEPKPAAAPATPPEPWRDPDPGRPVPFWRSLREDLIAHVPPEQRDRSTLGWACLALRIALRSPGFKIVFCYRFNHALRHRVGLPGKIIAGVVNWFVRLFCLTSIAPAARLYGGLILPHPQGIIIGGGVVVGPWAWIYQNVTIGGSAGKDGEPKVGRDCRIHCGAVLSGPIDVGDGVVVCPNSFVQRNVPGRSMAVGVPANVMPLFAGFKKDVK